MIIKKYNPKTKVAEVLNQYDVLHVDGSEFSRYAIGSLLMSYDFIVKKFFSVKSTDHIPEALNTETIDLLLINYSTCRFDFCNDLKKIKKVFPGIITVIYNFSHSRFEKIQLLKAGANALFDPDYPFEELLFALQELNAGSVFQNNLVDQSLLKKVKSTIVDSAKEFSKDEVSIIRDCCKGSEDKIAEKYKLTKAKADSIFNHLRLVTGCETQADFVRFAMMNKIIKPDEKLLAEVGLTAVS